jgi:hypothetical protein
MDDEVSYLNGPSGGVPESPGSNAQQHFMFGNDPLSPNQSAQPTTNYYTPSVALYLAMQVDFFTLIS